MASEMTIKEIARELQVSYITALNFVKSGKIRGGRQIGRDWRIPRAEFERFLQEGNATDATDISVPVEFKREE